MRVLVAITLVIVLVVAFAVPVFADHPLGPFHPGVLISEGAQNENGPGASPEIHEAQAEADINLGQSFKEFLGTYCGIPPRHIP